MPEESQGQTQGRGQEPNTPGPQQQAQGTQPAAQAATGQVFSADYVQSLRNEAAGYRVSAREWEQKHKDLQGQTQGLQAQINDLQSKLEAAQQAVQAERLEREAMRVAKELGISDVEAAIKLVDRGQIKLDDKGNPTNLADVLKGVAEKHPFILGGGSGTTNPPRGSTYTIEQIRKMPPEWINEHWGEVQAVLAGKP